MQHDRTISLRRQRRGHRGINAAVIEDDCEVFCHVSWFERASVCGSRKKDASPDAGGSPGCNAQLWRPPAREVGRTFLSALNP